MRRIAPLALFLALALPSFATNSAPEHRRIYMLGNSLTDDILYDGFKAIVASGSDTVALGSHRTPGAPVFFLWNNPGGSFTEAPYGYYPGAFTNYTWDAVTLQPFSTYNNELTAARWFAQALRGEATYGDPNNDDAIMDTPRTPLPGEPTGISPNAIVYIYAQWPTEMPDQWKSSAWLTTNSGTVNSAAYFDAFIPQIRSLEPATQFFLIPAGHVFHELYQQTRAGRFPGITRQFDLMEDPRHLNNRGSYIPALSFYSVIYKRDPRGMTAPPIYGLTAEQAAVVQAAVWKVVRNHPLCGIATSVVITTPSLADVVEDTAFSTSFSAALNQGAVTWSVTPGTSLPPGVNLSSNGTLTGTVAEPGAYDLSVRATDAGGASTDRAFILFVNSNNPPLIANTSLPSAPYGQPYNTQLTHTAGVGEVTWSISVGDLPHGLTLTPEGRIRGTPLSIRGTFNLTFAVTDSVGASSTKTLPLTVGAPGAATIIAGPTHAAPTINGALAESIWSSLPHTVARRVHGVSDNTATFAIRHDTDAFYVAVRVTDANVNADDAVHVFLDGLHDREAVYNADDRHIVVYANGTLQELNGRPSGITAAVTTITGGYSVEIRVPFANLDLADGRRSHAIGFDLGVEDVDTAGAPAAWQVWRAAHPDAPSPAVFGNLVLAGGPLSVNILANPTFDSALIATSFPGEATTDKAGLGWYRNGVPGRPFTVIDKLNYGYPSKAIVTAGSGASTCLYQVLLDNRTTTGRGVLRFDVKWADGDIAVRLYAYNGTAEQVDAVMNAVSQTHPPSAGTPAATLIATTLATTPSEATWREVVIPVDFGPGYDYYFFAFSGAGNSDTVVKIPIDGRIDNVELGPLLDQQSITPPSATITYADWATMIAWPLPADANSEADPDGDGMKNLLEYALLTDPLAANTSLTTLATTASTLSLSYLRARSDVTYAVETSTDLVNWTTTGVSQDTLTPVGGTATASIPYDSTTTPRRFLRLRVTR